MSELLYKAQGSHNVRLINISVGNVGDMSGSRRHRDVVQGLRCVFEIDIHRGRSGGAETGQGQKWACGTGCGLARPYRGELCGVCCSSEGPALGGPALGHHCRTLHLSVCGEVALGRAEP